MKKIFIFRLIALLEGLSFIFLVFLGMPLKYLYGNEMLVKILGMPHGILFIVYVLTAFLFKNKLELNIKELLIVLIASVIPFGTFYIDYRFLKSKF
ncbi:MAG: DUF3817 domain-containing protein [Bacteroidota bacterium]|jgi:integral membrane protein|nr:DUF3817 domain-containing protein [Bacteroidota bacterium]